MFPKILYYLRLLRSHRHVIDYSLMKMLLVPLVLPHLSYCVTVWGHRCKYSITKALENADLCSGALLWPKENMIICPTFVSDYDGCYYLTLFSLNPFV